MTALFGAAFGVAVITYLVFPIVLVVRGFVRRRTIVPQREGGFEPFVSVIIAARNEAHRIGPKLESIVASELPSFRREVIVASDGSTDETRSIVMRFADQGVSFVALPSVGKAAALQAAVVQARGDILVFTDAGGELEPSALTSLIEPFADPSVGGVAGDQRYRRDAREHGLSSGERTYWGLDRVLKRAEGRSGSVVSSTGALHAIRRELYEPIPPGVTDDAFLSMGVVARGSRLVFAPDAVAWEATAATPRAEFDRKVRVMTRGFRTIAARRALLNPFRYGFYSIELFAHKVLRRLMAPVLVVLMMSSLALWNAGPMYRFAAIAQIAAYGLGVVGLPLAGTRLGRVPVLAFPAFFVTANAAAVVALLRIARGQTVRSWEPTGHVVEPTIFEAFQRGSRPIRVLVPLLLASLIGTLASAVSPAFAVLMSIIIVGGCLLIRPDVSTYVAVGLIYSNATVIAVRVHGAPSVIGAVLPLLLLFSLFHYWFVRRFSVILSPVLLFVAGYLAVQALSAAVARDKRTAIASVVSFAVEGLALFFVITNVIRTREVLHRCVRVLLVLAAILSAFGVFHILTRDYDQSFGGFAEAQGEDPDGGFAAIDSTSAFRREAGPIGDPNRQAQFLLPMIPLGLGAAALARTRSRRYTAIGAVWLVLGGIILTFSRGAFLALAVTMLLMLALRQVKAAHLAAGAACLLVLIVALPAYRTRVSSLLDSAGLLRSGESGRADNAIQGRYTENIAALLAFIDHPVLGVGPGNFGAYYREYANLAPARVHQGERQAHNLYLGVAADTGVPGLVMILGVFFVTLRELWRARRFAVDEEGRALASKFLISIIGVMVTSVFLHFAFIRYYWLFIGLAVAAAHVAMKPADLDRSPVTLIERTGVPAV